jgi:hypothetical protein
MENGLIDEEFYGRLYIEFFAFLLVGKSYTAWVIFSHFFFSKNETCRFRYAELRQRKRTYPLFGKRE